MIFSDGLENIAILTDFDGTITATDTNVKLINTYAKEENKKIKKLREKGELDIINAIKLQFKYIKLTEEEYVNFILNNIDITKGFTKFYNNIKKHEIPFAIISGGFENGIKPFLNKYEIYDVDIYANKFIFNGRDIEVKFYDEEYKCEYDEEPCGNCKVKHYEKFKEENERVIFIGDGVTDRCVANVADIIFAKDSLVDYCEENDIDYIPWNDFNDINDMIFK